MSAKISGLKELSAALRELGPDISRNALRSSVRSAAKKVIDEARRRVPKNTGQLSRAIYMKQLRKESGDDRQTFIVGVRQGPKVNRKTKQKDYSQDGYYGRYIEFGHFTRGQKKVARTNIGKIAQHKGGSLKWVPAQPFMSPAFDSRKEDSVRVIAETIARRIKRARAKAGVS
jgi:HK97 gp10 family phage protein